MGTLVAAYGLEHITGVSPDDIDCWESPDPMAPGALKAPGAAESAGAAVPDNDDDPEMRVHAEDSGLAAPRAEPLRAWPVLQRQPAGRRFAGVAVDNAPQISHRAGLSLPQCGQLAFEQALRGQAGAIDLARAPIRLPLMERR